MGLQNLFLPCEVVICGLAGSFWKYLRLSEMRNSKDYQPRLSAGNNEIISQEILRLSAGNYGRYFDPRARV